MEITQALHNHVADKVEKIARRFDHVTNSNIVLRVEKTRHTAEATINAKGATLHATGTAADMYAAIDSMAGKLEPAGDQTQGKTRRPPSQRRIAETNAGMKTSAIDAPRAVDQAQNGTQAGAPAIGDFLDDRRVVIDLDVSSRKRLFEQMAKLLVSPGGNDDADGNGDDEADGNDGPDLDTVLHILTKREKLGCTGIGNGIALPHGRIEGLAEPLMAVARLKHAINYDAPDGVPVWLAVCLLAPVEANETHLRLLAALAARFSASGFPERLRQAPSAAELAAHLKNPLPV